MTTKGHYYHGHPWTIWMHPCFSCPFQLMRLQAKELAEKTCGGRSKDASCRSDSKTRPWICGGQLVYAGGCWAGIHGEPQQYEGPVTQSWSLTITTLFWDREGSHGVVSTPVVILNFDLNSSPACGEAIPVATQLLRWIFLPEHRRQCLSAHLAPAPNLG